MVRTHVLAMVLVSASATGFGPAVVRAADTEAGRAVFATKQCESCHKERGEPGTGPSLEQIRRPQGEMELAGRLWNHLPAMFASVTGAGVVWPDISVGEMRDLMAYLGAQPERDPAPDLVRGQTVLLRKGCLKCHSLRGEGGAVKPDLAERREDYASGAAWAATMWKHTPSMASMAHARGIPYPRFSEDEMANLLGLLRSASTTPPARSR